MVYKNLFFLFIGLLFICTKANSLEYHLYLEANLTGQSNLSQSAKQGIEVALEQYHTNPKKHSFKLIVLNNHGNVNHSLSHLKKITTDKKAIGIFNASSSELILKNKDFINHNQLLTFVSNATATSITRSKDENWIFRLGLDDAKIGYKMIEYTLSQKKCVAPHFFIENSNWGVQNLRTLTKAIAHHGTNASNVTKFNNDIQIPESKKMLLNIIESADCIVLIANPSQTSTIVKSMSKLNRDQRLPIIGHEALSKDNFIALTNTTIRKNIDLSFVQSCFSFTTNSHSADIQNIKQTLANLNASPQPNLPNPSVFAQSYDLAQILLQVADEINLSDNIHVARRQIKEKLENFPTPIKGIIKTYYQPFSPYHEENPFGHEALGTSDYCMAHYLENNEVNLIDEHNK